VSLKATTKRKDGDALGKLKKRLEALGNKEVAIGFPKGASDSQTYPSGENVISVAASHVYGVGVKERDFMTPAAAKIQKMAKPRIAMVGKIISRGGDPGEVEDILESDRKSTRLNSSHNSESRMPSSA
jgi:hypothetical protein